MNARERQCPCRGLARGAHPRGSARSPRRDLGPRGSKDGDIGIAGPQLQLNFTWKHSGVNAEHEFIGGNCPCGKQNCIGPDLKIVAVEIVQGLRLVFAGLREVGIREAVGVDLVADDENP